MLGRALPELEHQLRLPAVPFVTFVVVTAKVAWPVTSVVIALLWAPIKIEGVALATVTEQTSVLPPSTVVTVIVAEPTATGETTPVVLTVATEAALVDHVTLSSVASEGLTVALRAPAAPPTARLRLVGLRLTPVSNCQINPPTGQKESGLLCFPRGGSRWRRGREGSTGKGSSTTGERAGRRSELSAKRRSCPIGPSGTGRKGSRIKRPTGNPSL